MSENTLQFNAGKYQILRGGGVGAQIIFHSLYGLRSKPLVYIVGVAPSKNS